MSSITPISREEKLGFKILSKVTSNQFEVKISVVLTFLLEKLKNLNVNIKEEGRRIRKYNELFESKAR